MGRAFPIKRIFRPSSASNTIGARYRYHLARRPFLVFGLPFLTTMVAASFLLTPVTAIRYERHDRKVRQVTRDEELSLAANRRKVDVKEEYYVRFLLSLLAWRFHLGPEHVNTGRTRAYMGVGIKEMQGLKKTRIEA